MEEVPDFQMDMNFLEPPVIADDPLFGFPNLPEEHCNSPNDSDISDSCPASPSPVSSPSPHCSSSSSESGIEDVSDMEETSVGSTQVLVGDVFVKRENPSSPLNSLNQAQENGSGSKKRRKSCRKTSKDNSVLEELNKLLVETSMSSLSMSMDQSVSQPFQTQANMTGLEMMVGTQTTASPTSVSHSCPLSVQASQATTLAENHPISVSSQLTSTASVTKPSTSPPVTSQSRTRSKPARNSRKSDEPKIVIIEEPEEVAIFLQLIQSAVLLLNFHSLSGFATLNSWVNLKSLLKLSSHFFHEGLFLLF